jgi:septum site-determining protein MinC
MRPTLIIDKPVRTGQRIHAEGANLVVLAIVNAGAELIADGDIHIYAPLRGRALAGAHGNTAARIYAQSMEAELVAIAGYFQVFDEGIPDAVRGKFSQVYLDGERVVVTPLTSKR